MNDPLWYKDGAIYEAHVKSFYDSNNDGIGDFNGLAQKLDYLQGLGCAPVAAAVFPVTAERRRVRRRRLPERAFELR